MQYAHTNNFRMDRYIVLNVIGYAAPNDFIPRSAIPIDIASGLRIYMEYHLYCFSLIFSVYIRLYRENRQTLYITIH